MEQNRRLRPFGGSRTWGSFDVYPSRYGITRYRLVVFPPGLTPDERRLLRAWRTWPAWGTVLFLVAQIWLSHTMTTGWALAIAVALWLGSGVTACALAGGTRTGVRSLIAVALSGSPDEERLASLRVLTSVLLEADARRADGGLSEPEHETICWQVYERMALIAESVTKDHHGV
ncbi:hypothetical protein BH09ACT7_BH09ACT7_17500 [soil metagenome]